MGSLAAKLLLPTVSSLAFLPTVSIAAKRQFHMEAMVYFFTMFFVLVCHACEGPGLTFLCFMKYDLLQYFSIFGTALSMWVSLIALAEFDEPKRSTLVMFGVLTIAVRIYHDRWGYGVYSGPIGTAVLVITVKWLRMMKEKKGLYPDKSVYTQQVGPGFCFGALALMLRKRATGEPLRNWTAQLFAAACEDLALGVKDEGTLSRPADAAKSSTVDIVWYA
ncbi:Transmembrane protein 8C, partial [Ophiophagus hannah]